MLSVSGVSVDFPIQLATRLPDWSACGLQLRCIAARLSVRRVVLLIPQARHVRLVADILAGMSRGCYEDATRKLLPWNLSFTVHATMLTYRLTVEVFFSTVSVIITTMTAAEKIQNASQQNGKERKSSSSDFAPDGTKRGIRPYVRLISWKFVSTD